MKAARALMQSALAKPWLWAAAYIANLFLCLAWRGLDPSFALGYTKASHILLLSGLGVVLARKPEATMRTAAVWGATLALAEVYLLVWLVGSRLTARLTEALHSASMAQLAIGIAAVVAAVLGSFAVVTPFIVVRVELRRSGRAS